MKKKKKKNKKETYSSLEKKPYLELCICIETAIHMAWIKLETHLSECCDLGVDATLPAADCLLDCLIEDWLSLATKYKQMSPDKHIYTYKMYLHTFLKF